MSIIQVLKEIRDVACGEVQLDSCLDDTEALAWIFRRAEAALRPELIAKIGEVEGPLRHCDACGTEWTTGISTCPVCDMSYMAGQ